MRYKKLATIVLLLGMLMPVGFISAQPVCAAILSGYFPVHQGNYWNFSCPEETEIMSWAINGDFNLRDVGSVFMMYQGNGRVLCLKQDWKGVCVYAEITPKALYLPEKPYLFWPRDIPTEIGAVMQESVVFKIYTSPENNENFEQTGSETRHVSFEFKSSEDIQVAGRLHSFCTVIERITRRNQDAPVKETLWLAQGVGPVKIRVESGTSERVYTAISWSGSEKKVKSYALSRYFPLKPGLRWTYQDQGGSRYVNELKIPLKSKLKTDSLLMPFEDYLHDVQFVNMQDAGLAMPQKYLSPGGFCVADPDQDRPTIILPSRLVPGRFSISRSHAISRRWPSMIEMPISGLERIYSNVPMGIEDVTTPAGVFKDCIKISLVNTDRAYVVNFDSIRVGYIWLAPDVGIVKEDLINMYNYADPRMMHSIFDVRLWELARFDTVTPVPVLSYQEASEIVAAPEPSKQKPVVVKKTVAFEGMIWENNSQDMYEKAVESAPFFIRLLAKKRLLEGIKAKAGEQKIVSEDIVIKSFKESANKRFTQKFALELEKMRTQ